MTAFLNFLNPEATPPEAEAVAFVKSSQTE